MDFILIYEIYTRNTWNNKVAILYVWDLLYVVLVDGELIAGTRHNADGAKER